MGVEVHQRGHQNRKISGITGVQEAAAVDKKTRFQPFIIQPLVVEDITGKIRVPGQHLPDKAVLHDYRTPEVRVFINNAEVMEYDFHSGL
jgi:hypothetical protein